jgi:hypothetical protein
MLAGLDRTHLFEKIFPCKEANCGKEGHHSDAYPVITSVRIIVKETRLSFGLLVVSPTF